jgi:hypothetical protein
VPGTQWWGRLGEWSPGSAGPGDDSGQVPGAAPAHAAGSASVRGRAITIGAVSGQAAAGPAATADGAPRAAASATAIPLGGPAPAAAASGVVDPDLAYGPADPGYGPPGPDWYRRSAAAPAEPVAPEREAQAEESLTKRGPFEPIHHDELANEGQRTEGDGVPAGPGADLPDLQEMPEFDPVGGETPDLLDLGPDDPVDGALGGLRELYQKAEAIGFERLERNLDRLLDRQRTLITDYFTQSGGIGVVDLDAPQASISFDSAESLVGMRSELRTSR